METDRIAPLGLQFGGGNRYWTSGTYTHGPRAPGCERCEKEPRSGQISAEGQLPAGVRDGRECPELTVLTAQKMGGRRAPRRGRRELCGSGHGEKVGGAGARRSGEKGPQPRVLGLPGRGWDCGLSQKLSGKPARASSGEGRDRHGGGGPGRSGGRHGGWGPAGKSGPAPGRGLTWSAAADTQERQDSRFRG